MTDTNAEPRLGSNEDKEQMSRYDKLAKQITRDSKSRFLTLIICFGGESLPRALLISGVSSDMATSHPLIRRTVDSQIRVVRPENHCKGLFGFLLAKTTFSGESGNLFRRRTPEE